MHIYIYTLWENKTNEHLPPKSTQACVKLQSQPAEAIEIFTYLGNILEKDSSEENTADQKCVRHQGYLLKWKKSELVIQVTSRQTSYSSKTPYYTDLDVC